MKLGRFNIHPVEFGRFKLDGGAMFGVVPKPLWSRATSVDEQNRIDMAARGMLIQSDERNILVDTGIGYKMSEKLNQIYAVDFSTYTLEKSLRKLGLDENDITDVIITHLHFDHTGGSTKINEDGKIVPTFPNAAYWVQESQYHWALNPSDRDRASFMLENYVPLQESNCLNQVDGDVELFSSISVLKIDGHTFGQQMIKVQDGNETILYCADLIPTVAHIPLPYIMGYDLQPLITLEEKKRYLPQIYDEGWVLFFEHDPNVIMAKVEKREKGFMLGEKLMVTHV